MTDRTTSRARERRDENYSTRDEGGRRKPYSRRYRDSESTSPPRHRQRREHEADFQVSDKNRSSRYRSRSKDRRRRDDRRSHSHSRSRSPGPRYSSGNLPGRAAEPALPEKQRPNFEVSGKLAAETNTVQGTDIVLKYHEPPEARKPPASHPWRLYVFKGDSTLDELELHQRSCWLFGRERVVADYHLEHPSVSKQHAVIQFRYVEKRNEFGDRVGSVKPYLIDLGSANGTKVAGKDIPQSRYYELRSGDVVVFGDSSREYVIMLPPKA